MHAPRSALWFLRGVTSNERYISRVEHDALVSRQAQFVAESVQPSVFGPGRRVVATLFFGDYFQAVKDAERAVQAFCASH